MQIPSEMSHLSRQFKIHAHVYSQAVDSTLFLMKPTSATRLVFSNNIEKYMFMRATVEVTIAWEDCQHASNLIPRSVYINRQMETVCWLCRCHVTDPKQTIS
jgi:hypothetical protein